MSKGYVNNDHKGIFEVDFELKELDIRFVRKGLTDSVKKVNKDYSRSYEFLGAEFQPAEESSDVMKVKVKVKGDYKVLGAVTDYALHLPGVSSVNVSYPFRKLRKQKLDG